MPVTLTSAPPRHFARRRFKDYEDYVRHSINSTGGVSTVSTRVMDPLPRTYSARDWRRHERGLYRESAAMNEDSYMCVPCHTPSTHTVA